eukprot:scaffold120975_cov66-Phaeocystis_antarctica.AAC.8
MDEHAVVWRGEAGRVGGGDVGGAHLHLSTARFDPHLGDLLVRVCRDERTQYEDILRLVVRILPGGARCTQPVRLNLLACRLRACCPWERCPTMRQWHRRGTGQPLSASPKPGPRHRTRMAAGHLDPHILFLVGHCRASRALSAKCAQR